MTFRVGQKVVCVNDTQISNGIWGGDMPVKGRVYTVIGITDIYLDEDRSGLGLLLREISNHPDLKGSYRAARFRPAVERKTDISVFKAMLTPLGVEA